MNELNFAWMNLITEQIIQYIIQLFVYRFILWRGKTIRKKKIAKQRRESIRPTAISADFRSLRRGGQIQCPVSRPIQQKPGGSGLTESEQPLQGLFSAISKPIFATKYSLETSRRDLHNKLLCTAWIKSENHEKPKMPCRECCSFSVFLHPFYQKSVTANCRSENALRACMHCSKLTFF